MSTPTQEEIRSLEEENAELQQQASARQGELSEIDQRYLMDGEVYDRERIEGEIALHGRIIGEHFFHVGRKLLLLKEHEGHGYFIAALERLGLQPRTAQQWMKAALIVDKAKSETVSHLALTRILALGGLEEEELEALGDGQTVAGLHLDELDKMSPRELRTMVRGHRSEIEKQEKAYEKILREKEKALNKMEKQIVNPLAASEEEKRWAKIERLVLGARGEGGAIAKQIDHLRDSFAKLAEVPGVTMAELDAVKAQLHDGIVSEIFESARAAESCLLDLVPPRATRPDEGEDIAGLLDN